MENVQAYEAKLALTTIINTAASIGIDVDRLCHLAADTLISDDLPADVRPHAPAAIFWLGVCLGQLRDSEELSR